MKLVLGILATLCFVQLIECAAVVAEDGDDEEARARVYMKEKNERDAKRSNVGSIAAWNYDSNLTDANLKIKLEISAKNAKEEKEEWKKVNEFNWKSFKDPDLKRQFWLSSHLGTAALSEDKYERLQNIIASMQKTYSTVKICDYHQKDKCDLNYEPDLVNILAESRNAAELKHVWTEFRKATAKTRDEYKEYVDLVNEAAKLNGFNDNTEVWQWPYEDKNFQKDLAQLWEQLKPLYLQLHAYVRQQLRAKYGPEIVSERGPIPAHLLGNMWAQSWGNIEDFTLPYPGKTLDNVTGEMLKQNWTPTKMFKVAEEFFTSLNMSAMPESFWKNSILEKPKDGRELVCHASAWDFYDQKDFRIKQCTRVNNEDLETAHHEMGHIQYYLQYKDQPNIYRAGANPGFHEAVGDTLSLSASTKKHLKKINLVSKAEVDEKSAINELYSKAIHKIAFLPFGYLLDQWRWDVFSGKIAPEDYNCRYWQLRQNLQGVEPPVERTEEDFDPAAKYHIVANVPYIRYFVSFVVQFQFHRSLCEIAKEYDPADPAKPLYNCDIYNNKDAGNAMKQMLQLGASKPWQEALESLTGTRKMDASGILGYFEPLAKWLEKENKKNGAYVGWEPSTKACVKVTRKESSHKSN